MKIHLARKLATPLLIISLTPLACVNENIIQSRESDFKAAIDMAYGRSLENYAMAGEKDESLRERIFISIDSAGDKRASEVVSSLPDAKREALRIFADKQILQSSFKIDYPKSRLINFSGRFPKLIEALDAPIQSGELPISSASKRASKDASLEIDSWKR